MEKLERTTTKVMMAIVMVITPEVRKMACRMYDGVWKCVDVFGVSGVYRCMYLGFVL